jgi:hypothetical protein
MMQLTLYDDLPFVSLALTYRGATATVVQVLIDTGSASTIFAARVVAPIGILPEMTDDVYTVRGIGGTEAVFTRQIDRVAIEAQAVNNFEIEVGGMNYGFDIDGILGMDFLTRAGAIINLRDLRLDFAL